MDRGEAARGGPAGGGAIPSIRAELAYLVTGAGAALLLGAVGAEAALSTPALGGLLGLAAGAGVVVLLAGVGLGVAQLCYWGVGIVAATYVASALGTESSAQSGVIAAVGLLGSAELAGWAVDSRRRGLDDLLVHVHRLRAIALCLAVALGLAVLAQGAASLGSGGTVAAGLGVAAVLAGITGAWLLASRAR